MPENSVGATDLKQRSTSVDRKEYEIGGKKYFQKELVWGQVRQLKNLIPPTIALPKNFQLPTIMALLGENMHKIIAVLLIPEGGNPKDKDVEALAADLEFEISPEMVMKVVEDFFDCNPIVSLSEKLGGMIKTITEKIKSQATTPSTPSVSSSPEGTSPKETKSSGDTLQ